MSDHEFIGSAPNIGVRRELIWNHGLVLPVLALFHLLDEFRADDFSSSGDAAVLLGSEIKSLHEIIIAAGDWIFEVAVEFAGADESEEAFGVQRATMENGHGMQACAFKHIQTLVQVEKAGGLLVVNIELKKIVRQTSIEYRMLRVEPFAIQNETVSKNRFQCRTFHRSPLLEEIVLRMHSLGDLVAAALKDHPPGRVEMNANVCPVNFFFYDQRWIGDELLGIFSIEVLVIVRSLGPKKVRGARIFYEIVAGRTHSGM